jgi:hypothetical protein
MLYGDVEVGTRGRTFSRRALLYDIQINGEIVAHAAGQHEEMPNPMTVYKFFVQCVEDDPNGIE